MIRMVFHGVITEYHSDSIEMEQGIMMMQEHEELMIIHNGKRMVIKMFIIMLRNTQILVIGTY